MEKIEDLYAKQIRRSITERPYGLFVLDEWSSDEGGRWVCRWLEDDYSEYMTERQVLRRSRAFWLSAGTVLRTKHYGLVEVVRMTTRQQDKCGARHPSFVPKLVGFSGEMMVQPEAGDWFAYSVNTFEEYSVWKRKSGCPV